MLQSQNSICRQILRDCTQEGSTTCRLAHWNRIIHHLSNLSPSDGCNTTLIGCCLHIVSSSSQHQRLIIRVALITDEETWQAPRHLDNPHRLVESRPTSKSIPISRRLEIIRHRPTRWNCGESLGRRRSWSWPTSHGSRCIGYANFAVVE